VAPPAGCAAQPDHPRGLGRDAVRGHQLLLLADRAEEAERVHAEADQPHDRHRHQSRAGAQRDAHPFAFGRRGKHQEREHQPGRDLDPHADAKRGRGRAWMEAHPPRPGTQQQRGSEREHHQRVVVRATHGQHQQHRVQADERGCPARGLAQARGRLRDQRDRTEAGGHRQRLQRPQAAGEAQRGGRIAGQREQRAVRGVLKRPADEVKHLVGGGFGGHVGVRVQPVQRSQPRESQIAEHVLGDQRRPQRQHHVGQHDRARQRGQRQPRSPRQRQQIAGAHDQHQRLKAAFGEAHVQAAQRAGQPRRPATAASRDVLRGPRRGACAEQEHGRHDAEQAEPAQRSQNRRAGLIVSRRAGARGHPGAGAGGGCRGRGLDAPILTSPRRASVLRAR
jgi:hypothetical protein